MSSLVILAAAVFEISCGTDRQTYRQTNAAENPIRVTTVGVGNYFSLCI